jgi:hypothetical protein
MRLAPLALTFACILAGCAADCRDSNWRSRGYADGFGGNPPQDLRLAPACAGFSQAAYLEGWRDGYDEWYRLMGSIGLD